MCIQEKSKCQFKFSSLVQTHRLVLLPNEAKHCLLTEIVSLLQKRIRLALYKQRMTDGVVIAMGRYMHMNQSANKKLVVHWNWRVKYKSSLTPVI